MEVFTLVFYPFNVFSFKDNVRAIDAPRPLINSLFFSDDKLLMFSACPRLVFLLRHCWRVSPNCPYIDKHEIHLAKASAHLRFYLSLQIFIFFNLNRLIATIN